MELPRFSLAGKVALITGGSRGIGEATAVLFAQAGADVAVTSRKLPDLERVADLVRAEGRRAIAIEAHAGRMDGLQGIVDRTVEELGGLDVLVNNAGTSNYAPSMEMEERAWDAVMNLDLKGLFFLSQAAGRHMRDHGGGTIVNISSVDGVRPARTTPHYSIAKAGLIMATKCQAVEWAEHNIRVNCIAPGSIETRLYNANFALLPEEDRAAAKDASSRRVPQSRIGDPHEIADAALYFASDASSYVTGQTLVVDGGRLLV
ncbi:MAG: SDR family oxidoreductase [Chloroflexi bacterium]|jgi:NAD(P)-dependent dehydrogenase (short-subunit alcohol dehydrogenase family)|nr:SDR family oxidoreductase [Chloroflexota bacterium]